MNISSENIVDVFLRKISESLPVGERDAYHAWQKDQEYKASQKAVELEKKLQYKKAEQYAGDLTKFFNLDYTDSKYKIISNRNYILLDRDGDTDEICRVTDDRGIYFFSKFFKFLRSYINCEDLGDGIKISLSGKREDIGSLYGKLKKIGFYPTRFMDSGAHHLSVIMDQDKFMKAIKDGLRITDFTDTQPE